MKKIVLSWVARMNDFKDGAVDLAESPNLNMHRHFFAHDAHVLLSQNEEEDLQAELLVSAIRKEFPKHQVRIQYMDLYDVIDIHEIKPKVERVVMRLRDEAEMDLYWSPGTSMMQLAWYMVHVSGIAKTRIIQGRPARFTKPGEARYFETEFQASTTPVSIMVRSTPSLPQATGKDYRITPSIAPVYARAERIAAVENVTTLIRGESGTGKEHLARFIHLQSGRKTKPFVTVNCSAIGDSLLESRLFGYVKGAFTGADQDRPGWFEEANGGAIFLDEIGDISPAMQQSLLRVLQEGEIMPVGGTKPKQVDVRIIAATHRDLERMCGQGEFRWDLYYRLVVTELELPPLRMRGRAELGAMIQFFLKGKAQRFGKPELRLPPPVTELLCSYGFPGNLRELENLIENLYVFCDAEVSREDLPARFTRPDAESSLMLRDVEARHIAKVLEHHRGNQSQTAKVLGIALNTLKSKMKEYGIARMA